MITKKLAKSVFAGSCYVTESYVTSGHWAAAKALFFGAAADAVATQDAANAVYGKPERCMELTDEKVKRHLAPPDGLVAFERSAVMLDSETRVTRMFTSEDGSVAFVDEKFVQAFDLRTLYAKPGTDGKPVESAMWDAPADPQFVVMPMRQDIPASLALLAGRLKVAA